MEAVAADKRGDRDSPPASRDPFSRAIMSTGHSPGGGQTTMPAYDTFHEAVKRGLIKEGWTITDDPLMIEFGVLDVYIDLAAERLIAAERENQRIAVEIKSFLGPSLLTNFHTALGQFLVYDPEKETLEQWVT
jgi:hypothetical protein